MEPRKKTIYPNKKRGLSAEKEIAQWLEERGFWIDHQTSHFSSGSYGYPDIVALKDNKSYGIEAKSTRIYVNRKKWVEIGRIKFENHAVKMLYDYCQKTGLTPIVLVLIIIRSRENLVWYFPFDVVLSKYNPGKLGFTISLYDVFSLGLNAFLYFELDNETESRYRDIRNFI